MKSDIKEGMQMTSATKYDEVTAIIVSMAKAKMIMNSHKGNIENVSVDVLVKLAKTELDELREAVDSDGDYTHIIEEAADVLNYTIGVCYNAIEGYRNRKSTKGTGHQATDNGPC
ncbi:MAG: hypothetical protein JRC86_07955 [Deltaproteobacteria bacterium]|nr:hypothetical protein [Deltaproteobacteria bacterium]